MTDTKTLRLKERYSIISKQKLTQIKLRNIVTYLQFLVNRKIAGKDQHLRKYTNFAK